MGYRNPIRSLPADSITSGEFTGTYTIPGRFVVGDPAGARIELDGSVPSEKLYAADGTLRVALLPALDLSALGLGVVQALALYSGITAEQIPGYLYGYSAGAPARPIVQLGPATTDTTQSQPYVKLLGGVTGFDGLAELGIGAEMDVYGDPAGFAQWRFHTDVRMYDGHVIDSTDSWHGTVPANGWTNFGGSWQPSRYRMLATGVVVCQGLLTGGTTTVGTRLFTLPAGYRPANDHVFGVISGGATLCRVDVHSDGTVTLGSAPSNTYLSLDGIRFTADA